MVLLDVGVDLSVVIDEESGSYGFLFFFVVKCDRFDLVKILVECGVDVNFKVGLFIIVF